jgi:hypothetical protein
MNSWLVLQEPHQPQTELHGMDLVSSISIHKRLRSATSRLLHF